MENKEVVEESHSDTQVVNAHYHSMKEKFENRNSTSSESLEMEKSDGPDKSSFAYESESKQGNKTCLCYGFIESSVMTFRCKMYHMSTLGGTKSVEEPVPPLSR